MSVNKTPEYNTVTFGDIYDNVDTFLNGSDEHELYDIIGLHTIEEFSDCITDNSAKLLYYLLYAKYGNSPIANRDINQFQLKLFSTVFQYGPTWEKRLDIQKKLRTLTDDQILEGSKAIFNHAFNPSSAPSTDTDTELAYVNDQNVNKYKRGKLEGYGTLWELLKVDVTENFLNQFRKLFKTFVRPEETLVYITSVEEDEENESIDN